MADKKKKAHQRRGLGRGIGALIPENQAERPSRPIDVFFSTSHSPKVNSVDDLKPFSNNQSAISPDNQFISTAISEAAISETPADSVSRETGKNVSRETLAQQTQQETPHDQSEQVSNKRHISTETESPVEDTNTVQVPASRNESEDLVPVPGATFGELNVEEIVANTKQPRQIFDEDELQELSDSIKEVGVLQPIVVRPYRDGKETADRNEGREQGVKESQPRYELIMGERRWRAAQLAGLTTIPAIVRHTSDSDLLRDALLENLHRTQLNALEEAAAYQQLLDDFHITQEELSKRIARSRPQISNTLRLLKLPPLVQRRVAAGVLSAGHARALLSLNDPAAMERLAQRIVAEGLSVRNVEEIVAFRAGVEEGKKKPRHRAKQFETELNMVAQRLGDRFDTRVKVQMGAKKGRMSIEFANIDDLNRILAIFGDHGVDLGTSDS